MSFAERGFEVVRGALAPERCAALRERLSELIARAGAEHARGERRADFWAQMPRSRHAIEVFWQDDGRRGFEERLVMRVGHGLHLGDERFADAILRSPVAGALARAVGGPTDVVQSAVIYKQPESDAVQFGMHQDAAYLSPTPGPLVLAFVALDPCDAENGALEVAPGSHRLGQGPFLRLTPNGFVEARRGQRAALGPGELLEMEPGDVALVHGLTYHASAPNRAKRPRRALVVHAIPAGATLEENGWMTVPEGGFARVG